MKLSAKTWIAVAACAIAVAAICVVLVFASRAKGGAEPNSAPPEKREIAQPRHDVARPPRPGRKGEGALATAVSATTEEGKSVAAEPPAPSDPAGPDGDDDDEDDDGLTPEERALSKLIDDLDEDKPGDLEKAVACAKEALDCPNAEIRQDMVTALGRFGEKALPQLTPFLVDPDEDVRDSAMNEWTMALGEIEDEPEKIGIVELAMNVLTDEDALESIADEYIGADEKLAVESLLRIIEGGGSEEGIAKAKETYEFVTGDEFTDRAAAEKWIAEEYVPDEDPQQEQMK